MICPSPYGRKGTIVKSPAHCIVWRICSKQCSIYANLSALKISGESGRYHTIILTLQFFGHIMFVVDRVVLRVQGFANRIKAMQRMHDLHSERCEFLCSQSDLGIATPRCSGFIMGIGLSSCTPSSSLRKRYWPAIHIRFMSVSKG